MINLQYFDEDTLLTAKTFKSWVTNINFLPTISLHHQEKRLGEVVK